MEVSYTIVGAEIRLVSRNLVQNIYSCDALEELQRCREEARGKPWSSGVIPEVFLSKVLGKSQVESASLPPLASLQLSLPL